ncbi:MAG TPA: hypothetical protein PLD02_11145, partial [Saprospiraceae bacterium]|nr:hypothetical protein [Saprospiraceae bacterium]
MIRISSSATLIFALFIPLFWLVFFGSLTLAIMLADSEDLSFSSPFLIKLFFISGFVLFGTLIYFTLFR